MIFILNGDANYSQSFSKNFMAQYFYDSLMFAGLKLSNREDSEIKKPYCISRLHVQYILNVLS